MRRFFLIGWVSALAFAGAAAVEAHETDQFLMPPPEEGEFADIGPYINDIFAAAIIDGVARANASIAAQESKRSPDQAKLRWLRSPEGVAKLVRRELPTAMELIEGLERRLPRPEFRAKYDGDITIYKKHFEGGMHTGLHAVYDPRQIGRLWRAGTVNCYGTYLGTDKLGHFLDMGYMYYERYRESLDAGMDEERAMSAAVYIGTKSPFISEKALLGTMSSGAYSNADLASNYVGCLYYRNLTETIMLNGEPCPPTVRLNDDGRWEVEAFVVDNPRFFARYICDHYNEALNPSLFQKGMRKRARSAVSERREFLLNTWYADESGEPRPAAWFAEKALELATYCGLDYGHSRQFDQLVHLGNTGPEPEPESDESVAAKAGD